MSSSLNYSIIKIQEDLNIHKSYFKNYFFNFFRQKLKKMNSISLFNKKYFSRLISKNISNLQTALGPNTQIELVAHGAGISILVDGKTTQKAKIAELAATGVLFKACENTIRERKIDRATILTQAGTVPSGVAEVVLKQEAGWSYLKY